LGIADRNFELVKGMPDSEAIRILRLVERVRGERATVAPAQRLVDLSLFRRYRGRYDGAGIEREARYDRAGLR
jgi:hypothetical protein